MRKSILYTLFGLGKVPTKVRPLLEDEGVVIMDEGMPGSLMMRKVKGPRRRYHYRVEGFAGSLVITQKRLLAFTFSKRQINIAIDDPRLADLHVDLPEPQKLTISFEASDFREDWSGIMEFRFKTDQAQQFHDKLIECGASQGIARAET